MKLTAFRSYRYALPFKRPIDIHGIAVSQREGLMIRLTCSGGVDGFGEVVPLAGWSRENLKEAYDQIQFLKSSLTGEHIPGGIERLGGKFESWLEGMQLGSSVRFGLEMAVLNLTANSNNVPLFKVISDVGRGQVRINGLLQGTRYDVVREAKKLKEDGFTTVKLKVGGAVEGNIDKVNAVSEVLAGEVLLHLDANRSWDIEDAIKFGKGIDFGCVTYIEEPLKDIRQIPEFYKETLIPVALDESLLEMTFPDIQSIEGVDVVVVKPTLLGGIEKSVEIIQQARAVGLQTVVSSAFESGLGLLTLANLAGCTSRDDEAGLDTVKYFRQDLLKEKLVIQNGKIDVSQRLVREEDINFGLLEEVK